jgi:hypothetical protein
MVSNSKEAIPSLRSLPAGLQGGTTEAIYCKIGDCFASLAMTAFYNRAFDTASKLNN